MAFTEFTIEGEAILGYFSDKSFDEDRHVRIKDNDEQAAGSSELPAVPVGMGQQVGQRVEQLIAKSLGFPNDSEFEGMSNRLEELREKGLQPADGIPDIIRTGTRLKITVEVID